jgi:hypothetical protein
MRLSRACLGKKWSVTIHEKESSKQKKRFFLLLCDAFLLQGNILLQAGDKAEAVPLLQEAVVRDEKQNTQPKPTARLRHLIAGTFHTRDEPQKHKPSHPPQA